jgi:hypothetical protein
LQRVRAARLAGPALWAAAQLRVAQWDARTKDPRSAQERTLLQIVRAAERTEFGRAHGFDRIRSVADFQRQVPARTYADFEPMLDRMRAGARDVLHPGFVYYWGCSSGTSHTAANLKYLPISQEQIRWQQRAGFDVVARYLTLWGDRSFPGGYLMGLFPPSTIRQVGPVGIASNPAIMQLHVPFPASALQLPKPPVRDIADYDEKLVATAEAYLDHDVWALTGTTCWYSVLFDHLLAAAKRRGLPARTVGELWPNLRVLFAGGVPAEPYRKLIEGRVGRPLAILENYSATEGGFLAVSDTRDDPATMRMLPDRGVFFEFARDGRRVPLWDVAPNVDYSVLLTTSSGLFAYEIGDFVRFSSVFPHRMRFVGRAAGVLSLTQELMTAGEIERAVAEAARVTRSTSVEFSASSELSVDGTAKGRYVLFVEFEQGPPDLRAFGAVFDHELCAQNRVYKEHRAKDAAILAPLVVPLAQGATRQFMRDLGPTSFQQKFPHIVEPEKRDRLRALERT